MIRLRHKLFIYALRGLDQAILYATLFVVIDRTSDSSAASPIHEVLWQAYHPSDTFGIVLLAVGWVLIFSGNYQTNRFTTLRAELADVAKATSLAAFLLLLVSTVFSFSRVDNHVVALVWGVSTLLAGISRIVARRFLSAVRRSGYNYRHLLIVGNNAEAHAMAERLMSLPELGYKVVGFISEEPPSDAPLPPNVLGRLDCIQSVLEKGPVDEIVICLPVRPFIATVFDVVRWAQELGIVVRLFPDGASAKILSRVYVETFEGAPVVTLFRETMILQLLVKRMMDFFVSLALLILLSPLLLAVAAIIKITSPGPIFFVQQRVGMNKRTFSLYKFRSMFIDAEKRRRELEHLNEMDGPVFKIKNDPRITAVGRFIRKTSIDELPQLVNVLRGQMSLVGPRPPLPVEVDQYDWLYRKRLSIKPGITCLWQVSGRNQITFKQWMAMDRDYIENWSIWLDLRILAKTVPTVLFGRGAS
jgi:exopolysaccharide biosynthesis polyprenyl glycosylphosphotransferase